MHQEFAAVCRRAKVSLPKLFMIMMSNTLVGYGSYANEDAHYRAFIDCVIREAEWEYRGRNELPMIGMDLASAGVPEAELTALSQRTGARRCASVELDETNKVAKAEQKVLPARRKHAGSLGAWVL
jgi:hypothetical protein